MRFNVHSTREFPTSVWNHFDENDVQTNVKAVVAGDTVYVTLRRNGEVIERRGHLVEDRVLTVGSGERLYERLVKATVSSLNGDIVGSDRTRIGAAEDYASKVLAEVLRQERLAAQR